MNEGTLGTISVDLVLNDASFKNSLNSAVANAKGAADKIDFSSIGRNAANAFGGVSAAIGHIAWNTLQAGATAGGAAISALGIRGILSANQLQTMQISLNGLTHSVNLGAQAMAGALKFAQQSPFQLPEVAGTTKTLIAFGQTAKDAVDSLGLLGNISITTGIPLQALGDIFGQISARGHIMQQDIQQLSQNGVAVLPALEKEFGKTADQIDSMVTKGQISFAQFKTALGSIVDPAILAQLTNTLPRQLDRLGGSLRILSNAFVGVGVDAVHGFTSASNGIDQTITTLVKTVADALRSPQLLAAATAVGDQVAKVINAITPLVIPLVNGIATIATSISHFGALALPVLGLVAAGFSGLAGDIPIIGKAISGLTGPMGLIIGLVAALIASSPQLRAGIGQAFTILGQTLVAVRPIFSSIIGLVGQIATTLGNSLAPLLPALAQAFSQVAIALLPLVPALLKIVIALLPLIPLLVELLLVILPPLTQLLVLFVNILTKAANALANGITAALHDLKTVITDVVPVFNILMAALLGADPTVSIAPGFIKLAQSMQGIQLASLAVQHAIAALIKGGFSLIQNTLKTVQQAFQATTAFIQEHRKGLEQLEGVLAIVLGPAFLKLAVTAAIAGAQIAAAAVVAAAGWVANAVKVSVAWAIEFAKITAAAVVTAVKTAAEAVIAGIAWAAQAIGISAVWIAQFALIGARAVITAGVLSAQAIIGGFAWIAQGLAVATVWLVTVFPGMVAGAVTAAASFVAQAAIASAAWIAKAAETAVAWVVAFPGMVAEAVTTAAVFVVQAAIASAGWIAEAAATSAAWVAAFAVMIAEAIAAKAEFVTTAIAAGVAWLAALGPIGLLIAAIIGVIAIVAIVIAKFAPLRNFFLNLFGDIGRAVNSFVGGFVQAGGDIISGLVRGIGNNAGAVINKIKEICSQSLDAVKKFFGIHSPSTVMAQMGSFLMEGFAGGIVSGGSMAADAISGVGKTLLGQLGGVNGNLNLGVSGGSSGGARGGVTQNNTYIVNTTVDFAQQRKEDAWRLSQ